MKTCPFCIEEIREQAVVCPHCGRDLVARRVRRAPRPPHPRDWVSRTASFGCGVLLFVAVAGVAIVGVKELLWP